MKLRSYLYSLALVAVLPLLAFSGVMIVSIFLDHVKAVKEALGDTASAISLAVDRKLMASIETLSALGSSNLLDTDNLEKFRVQVERVLAGHETWSTVALLDLSGRPILDLSKFATSSPPPDEGGASFRDALTTKAPAVSDLITDRGNPIVYVAVPVIRESRVRAVLIAGIEPPVASGLLSSGGLPSDRLALLIDKRKVIVARSANSEQFVGKPATPELARQSEASVGGAFSDVRIDGVSVHVGFHRSELSGWTVATTVPMALVNRPLWRRLGLLLLVGALLIGLGVTGAWWFERRIREPIVALSSAAAGLARGGPAGALPSSPIVEIDSLAHSIALADQLLRERAAGWRQAETELADQREQFRTTLSSISDGVIATDETGRVTFMNDVALALTGWMTEPAVGQSLDAVLAILDEESRSPIDGLFGRVMRDGTIAETGRRTIIRSRGGDETPVECRGAPRRDADGRTVGAVLVCRDASERRRAERERAEILARAHSARDEAEAANRAKDEFLAMLGHELRNPLGAISNALYVLELIGAQTAPAIQARQVVGRGIEQLTRMVDDLLDVARVTRGKVVLDRRPVNLAETVTQSLSALSTAGRAARHQITVDVEPVWINADPVRVQQVVTNLIVNAIKYTPADGTIHVTVGRDDDQAVVRVADNGIGISTDMLPRVFEPFAQGDRTLERAPGGLGIGLTLARRLVEAHAGAIEVQSDGPGLGSTFTVRLPRVAAPNADHASAPAESEAAPRRILLVEDGQDARDMLRVYLAQMGHQVYEAADGPSGVEAALRVLPDVALIDIGLPGLDGYEVARRIRAAPGGQHLYLVAVSGYGQPKDREQALASGFDDYLVKPFDRDRMATLLTVARRA
jgi:PAS domain S-box-containing protein